MKETLGLLLGTVVHRPYVFAFFACFLCFAIRHLRLAGAISFTLLAFTIAFAAEYSSTRNGFPFGLYQYVDTTRTRELWISNVPFWDSLSFVFLSYFSWIVAGAILRPETPGKGLLLWRAAPLAGFLMMILDLVIDPVALRGGEWFLGQVYYYPRRGLYFGVTLTNFLGWFLVGMTIVGAAQLLSKSRFGPMAKPALLTRDTAWSCLGMYAAVLIFNLAITAWIGLWHVFYVGAAISSVTLTACARIFENGFIRHGVQRYEQRVQPRILICTATSFETDACRKGIERSGAADQFEIFCTGVGGTKAAETLRQFLADNPGFERIVSAGFAGSVSGRIGIGTWVIGTQIKSPSGKVFKSNPLPGCIREMAPFPLQPVRIRSAPALVVQDPKNPHLDCDAVDMESHSFAELAQMHGLPFHVIRLISDSPDQPMPSAMKSWTASGLSNSRSEQAKLVGKGLIEASQAPAQLARFARSSAKLLAELERGWLCLAKQWASGAAQ